MNERLMQLVVNPAQAAIHPGNLLIALSNNMIIPVLLLVLFFQRLIVSGLTKGAIK